MNKEKKSELEIYNFCPLGQKNCTTKCNDEWWVQSEVGKVSIKSNCDEALNDEFILKSNGDEVLNDGFP